MKTILALLSLCGLAHGATHIIKPGQGIQQAIDRSAGGDVIVLEDGMYHGPLDIRRSITLRARHGGEATVTNRHGGAVAWTETAPGSRTWFAGGIDWPVHGLLVEGVHAFDYRSKENFDQRLCGPYWSKGWQAERKSYRKMRDQVLGLL